ncbi:MAG: DedA family protein [Anaerolineaceae bacterium]|nr:DedA family protein [Anaerolineaceae bacterium]
MIALLENNILPILNNLYNAWGWLGVALMLILENATGITPSEVILGLAGWMLVANNQANPTVILLGALFAAIGSLIGASITYWISRLGGRPVVMKLAHWLHIKSDHVTKVENQFQNWGPGIVLIGRMMPGVRTLINIPAGLADMSFVPFMINTFIGSYFWCALLIGAGYLLGQNWMLISDYLNQYFLYILAVGTFLILAYFLIRKRKPISSLQ